MNQERGSLRFSERWPMTWTCGFSHAATNLLVISSRDWVKCECTLATHTSKPEIGRAHV